MGWLFAIRNYTVQQCHDACYFVQISGERGGFTAVLHRPAKGSFDLVAISARKHIWHYYYYHAFISNFTLLYQHYYEIALIWGHMVTSYLQISEFYWYTVLVCSLLPFPRSELSVLSAQCEAAQPLVWLHPAILAASLLSPRSRAAAQTCRLQNVSAAGTTCLLATCQGVN